VWYADIAGVGRHFLIVLGARRRNVTGVMVTHSEGPAESHIPLTAEDGLRLTGYTVSYANTTDIRTVNLPAIRSRHGRLRYAKLREIENAVRDYLGLS
jgi:mRNA-degrading endonuclease toxin of MazEF toxin-antitoxin module